MNYELFMQEPAAYLFVLFVQLIITLLAYGFFPLLFSKIRNKSITKRKYKFICYIVNFLILVIFMICNGGTSNGVPYLLWTGVFSRCGVNILCRRRVIDSELENPIAIKKEQEVEDTATMKTKEEWLREIAVEAVENTKANGSVQGRGDGDADFGLVPEKPIFTRAVEAVSGEKEYLNSLYTAEGDKITYTRRGSMSVEGISGMIDIYDTYLPSGAFYKTLYINMYGLQATQKAPAGFMIYHAEKLPQVSVQQSRPQKQKKKKAPKIRYCSRCGSLIDSETKKCTGCGKQYFRGFRHKKVPVSKKSTVSVIVLTLLLVAVSALSVWQYVNVQEIMTEKQTVMEQQEQKIADLEQKIEETADLKQQLRVRENAIKLLQEKIGNLEDEIEESIPLISFVDKHVVFIENDGTNKYHKFECIKFKRKSFWVYNTEAAKGKGYTPCSLCQ